MRHGLDNECGPATVQSPASTHCNPNWPPHVLHATLPLPMVNARVSHAVHELDPFDAEKELRWHLVHRPPERENSPCSQFEQADEREGLD